MEGSITHSKFAFFVLLPFVKRSVVAKLFHLIGLIIPANNTSKLTSEMLERVEYGSSILLCNLVWYILPFELLTLFSHRQDSTNLEV